MGRGRYHCCCFGCTCCWSLCGATGHGGFEERSLFRFLALEFSTFGPFTAKLGADHKEEKELSLAIQAALDAATTLAEESFSLDTIADKLRVAQQLLIEYRCVC